MCVHCASKSWCMCRLAIQGWGRMIECFAIFHTTAQVITKVNEARQELFSKKFRTLEKIPPNQGALLQHTKCSVYQGGHIWAQTLMTQSVLPSPSEWGWQHNDKFWTPIWTTLPQMKDTCYELIRCNCRTAHTGHCKCVKASLASTGSCNCGG